MLKPSALPQTPPPSEAQTANDLVNRTPIFYGWVILAVSTLGMIMTTPGQTFGVSVFIPYFMQDLNITRTEVSSLYALGTLVGSFALPFVGRLIDRYGPRSMVTIISLLLAFVCIYMGYVQNALMLGLGFFGLRMLGQGSLSLVCTNVINQWWVRRRGTILGLAGVLMGIFGLAGIPNLLNWLIPIYGWRTVYMGMGAVLLFVMTPLGYGLFRNRPEEHGLQPDGVGFLAPSKRMPHGKPASDAAHIEREKSTGESKHSQPAELLEENWTMPEAVRTPLYWTFNAGLASIAMLSTGITFHMVSIFEDVGLTPTLAAAVFVPMAGTMAVVNLGSGILVDRVRLRTLMALALFLQALALWMVPYLGLTGLSFGFGMVLGTIFGLMRTVSTVAWAKYFGRLHLGAISGVTGTILAGSSAFGPVLMGYTRDLFGSYASTLNLLALLPLLLGVVSLFVQRPQKAQ